MADRSERPRLSPVEVADRLEATLRLIPVYVLAESDDVLRAHAAAGEWCAKECLAHVIEADQTSFGGFVRGVMAGDGFTLPQRNGAAEGANPACERSADELLQEFASSRQAALGTLRGMTAVDLARTGRRFGNDVAIGQVIQGWTGHDVGHFAQLLATIRTAAASRALPARP